MSDLDDGAADDERVCFCRVIAVKASVYEDKVSASPIGTTW